MRRAAVGRFWAEVAEWSLACAGLQFLMFFRDLGPVRACSSLVGTCD